MHLMRYIKIIFFLICTATVLTVSSFLEGCNDNKSGGTTTKSGTTQTNPSTVGSTMKNDFGEKHTTPSSTKLRSDGTQKGATALAIDTPVKDAGVLDNKFFSTKTPITPTATLDPKLDAAIQLYSEMIVLDEVADSAKRDTLSAAIRALNLQEFLIPAHLFIMCRDNPVSNICDTFDSQRNFVDSLIREIRKPVKQGPGKVANAAGMKVDRPNLVIAAPKAVNNLVANPPAAVVRMTTLDGNIDFAINEFSEIQAMTKVNGDPTAIQQKRDAIAKLNIMEELIDTYNRNASPLSGIESRVNVSCNRMERVANLQDICAGGHPSKDMFASELYRFLSDSYLKFLRDLPLPEKLERAILLYSEDQSIPSYLVPYSSNKNEKKMELLVLPADLSEDAIAQQLTSMCTNGTDIAHLAKTCKGNRSDFAENLLQLIQHLGPPPMRL